MKDLAFLYVAMSPQTRRLYPLAVDCANGVFPKDALIQEGLLTEEELKRYKKDMCPKGVDNITVQ